MKSRLILVALLGAAAQVASAASWLPLTGGEKMEVQIDTDSIASAGGSLIKGWVTHSFLEQKVSASYPTFYYKSAMVLEVYNCAERTSATMQEIFIQRRREAAVWLSRSAIRGKI